MKRKIIYTLLVISAILVLFPVGAIFIEREYDLSQSFVGQPFNQESEDSCEVEGERIVRQSFRAEADNLTGIDLVIPSTNGVQFEIENGEGRIIRAAEIEESFFVNSSDITRLRFEPIEEAENNTYALVFNYASCDLLYSDEDFYENGELFINNDPVHGDLNFVPVYKAESLSGYIRTISSRIFFFF